MPPGADSLQSARAVEDGAKVGVGAGKGAVAGGGDAQEKANGGGVERFGADLEATGVQEGKASMSGNRLTALFKSTVE